MRRSPTVPIRSKDAWWTGIALVALLIAAAVPVAAGPARLFEEATLRPDSAKGGFYGLLAGGIPVELLERRGEWARVAVSAWIPDDAWSLENGSTSIADEVSLLEAAGGRRSWGLLAPGTPIELVTRDEAWTEIRVVGWVEAARVDAAGTPPAATVEGSAASAASGAASSSVPAAGGSAAIEVSGLVKVKLGSRNRVRGAGARVWLVPQDIVVRSELLPDEVAELQRIDQDLVELERADREARWDDDLYASAERRTRISGDRRRVLAERGDLLALRHGRHEAVARASAVTSTVADDRGYFELPAVEAGRYKLYVRFVDDALDLEWVRPMSHPGGRVELSFDERDADGLPPRTAR